jgi:hypothetical protein
MVLGGVAAVGFGLAAKSQENEVRGSGCAPACDNASKSSIESKILFGNIGIAAFGVGLGTAVISTIVANMHSETKSAATLRPSVSVSSLPGGAALGLSGAF